ncbi:Vitamin B12 transporter BtuB [Halomonadaceae bacterium LMG 33818]|uniref:TonB-dependent receptor n=1 Tax=Cernens ardua TaxID=3402176 RepID=UPI003EDC8DF0
MNLRSSGTWQGAPAFSSVARHPLFNKRPALVCASVSTLLVAVALHTSHAYAQSSSDYVAPAASSSSSSGAAAPAAAAPAAPAAAAPAAPAAAAPAATVGTAGTQQLKNVTVTGSAIATPDAATAVPVTIYHASQLRAEGITSADQFLQTLGINNSSANATAQNSGPYQGGASFADLRGLGTDMTLVLLNGRRVIANSYAGAGVDLNSIPFAAIDRVEVLRDSAGALYGSDAVAGVINFITKKNYQGAEVSADLDTPTHSGGGQSKTYTGTWGYGDLDKDGFNWMGSLSYSNQNELPTGSRHFWHNGFRPYYGSVYRNGATFQQSGPYLQQGCFGSRPTSHGVCGAKDWDEGDYINHNENTSLYTAATFKESEHNQGQLSYYWSHNYTNFKSYPDILQLDVEPGSPSFPTSNSSSAFDPTQAATAYWLSPLESDRMGQKSDVKRIQFEQKGSFGGWTYDTAIAYDRSTTHWRGNQGYLNFNDVQSQVDSGLLNPFYPSTPAEVKLLEGDKWSGTLEKSWGSEYIWDGHIGHSLGDWFGAGPAQIALGAEASHERFSQTDYDNPVQSSGIQASHVAGHRDQQALWTEVDVPILDSLDLTGSLRYDRYSSVGHTTNPKISFRYQPLSNLVFRGSWSSAFVAPTLYDLYTPQSLTYAGNLRDPLLCPKGGSGNGCSIDPRFVTGGNPRLKPEKSNEWSFGLVYSPIHNLTTSADFWWYHIRDDITTEGDQYALDHDKNVCRYGQSCAENDHGPIGAIDYFHNPVANIGKVHTNGVDLTANYLLPTSIGNWNFGYNMTYVFNYNEDFGQGFTTGLGRMDSTNTVQFRWKGTANIGWSKGPWSAGLNSNFQSGYTDYQVNMPDYYVPHNKVASYTTFDVYGGYHFKNGIAVTIGSRNVFDRKPPFSTYQLYGIDTRYGNPLGRVVYANASYHF